VLGVDDSAGGVIPHLVQRSQEGAEHEGGEYDGEVILGQDVGLAIFPSRARPSLLFICISRGRGSGLGLFFGASHIPLFTGRGTGENSWDTMSDLINLLPHCYL
jgi:hypothetical protein